MLTVYYYFLTPTRIVTVGVTSMIDEHILKFDVASKPGFLNYFYVDQFKQLGILVDRWVLDISYKVIGTSKCPIIYYIVIWHPNMTEIQVLVP